jgi:hypothetical protein
MQARKIAVTVLAAGAVAGAAVGISAGTTTAEAAPAPPHKVQPAPQPQHQIVVHRPNYRPFAYRGVRVVPRFDKKRHQWGFTYHRTWIVVTTR